ncbi:MAG: asparagine synthase (glutamine-hydrolyzing) [Pseudomonadota bacterium]
MCGIVGIIDLSGGRGADVLGRQIQRMMRAIEHRGPDMSESWIDADAGIALGFQRLSIVDLSEAGAQPMVSASGRSVICYNGEVYNAPEMTELLGADRPVFRGHSDTEVLLEACEKLGAVEAVRATIAMFAISLWDRQTRTLRLFRDRLGIKPLYWLYRPGNLFAFGSELHALRALDGLNWNIDQRGLFEYLRTAYVPAPRTIYQGVQQLMPGQVLTFNGQNEPDIQDYWSLADSVDKAAQRRFEGSEEQAVQELELLLSDAVGRRMVADVPLGAFLSGGYDSSTVAALMQAQSQSPIRTYSIGFDVDAYNEADHADAVAAHLGTDHTRFNVTSDEALDVIPRLPEIYDQPFADSSQIPTFLVSQLARQHVTVALSGDGGDEVFAGYNRHMQADMIEARIGSLPLAVRKVASGGIRSISPKTWDQIIGVLPSRVRPQHAGEKLHKVADIMQVGDGDPYRALTSLWQKPEAIMTDAPAIEPETGKKLSPELPDLLSRMQFADTIGYMPGDCLTKVDRASMAASLEVRVPLIDHRVVEFAWTLPKHMKVRDGAGKWLLRQVLYKHVPKQLVDRPKMGFGVPIDQWLRGPLRDWAEDLFEPQDLSLGGLQHSVIREAWSNHLSGRANNQYGLWTILMYQAWRRREKLV